MIHGTMTPLVNQEATKMTENERKDDMSAWLTVRQAAAELEMSEQWTRTLIRRGFIEAQKFGRDWLVSRASIDTYKRERDNPPA